MFNPRYPCNFVGPLVRAVVLLLLASVRIEAGLPGPTAGAWTTFGNGPTHSGFYPATIGDVPISEGWTKSFPTAINQVAVLDGHVFVTSTGTGWVGGPEMLAASLDVDTGSEIWRSSLQYPSSVSSPTISDGYVFFYVKQSQSSHVLGLRIGDGYVIRDFTIESQGYNKMPPTIFGDGLFVRAGYFGGMKGYNLSNGAQRFFVNLDQYDDWTPTYDGNALYSCISGVFRANHPVTGAELWVVDFRRPGESLFFAAQPVVANNKASVISFGFVSPKAGDSVNLTTIDLSTGLVAWYAPNGIDPHTGDIIGYKGVPATDGDKVYSIYGSSSVRALDAQTGQVLGSYEADYQPNYSLIGQPIITNDLVIVSRSGFPGRTYIFDKATYTLRTTLLRGGEISFAGDVLYVASPLNVGMSDGGTATLATYRFRAGVTPPPAPVRNISTRLNIGTVEKVGIGGFILTGTAPKKIMIRGIGPSLTGAGVTSVLADPTLELNNSFSGAVLARNDNWQTTQIGGVITTDQVAEIQATTIAPTDPRESAMVVTLQPGAYTAVTRGANDTTGTGLVEIYDLNASSGSKLANISTRGFIENNGVMIAGFIVDYQDARIIARAIGPSVWLGGPQLPNPTLELHDRDGSVVAFNDNWKDTQQAEIEATTIPPTNDLESAIVRTLAPGNYTAVVRGVNPTMHGLALVEVYNLQ
jgi:hypothetical protein